MTNAEHTPPGLLAERFGGVTGVGERARFLATMHALITWFADHPDVPTPCSIAFGADVDGERLAELAASHGVAIYPDHDPRQITLSPLGGDPRSEFYAPFHIRRARPERPL